MQAVSCLIQRSDFSGHFIVICFAIGGCVYMGCTESIDSSPGLLNWCARRLRNVLFLLIFHMGRGSGINCSLGCTNLPEEFVKCDPLFSTVQMVWHCG